MASTSNLGATSSADVRRARTASIPQLLGEHDTPLRRNAQERLVSVCPFCGHPDETLGVWLMNGGFLFACWVCGVGGDAIALTQHLRDLPYDEAVAYLVKRLAAGELT